MLGFCDNSATPIKSLKGSKLQQAAFFVFGLLSG